MRTPDTSKARVLVVGDVMLDRYWYGDASRISPEAPVPVLLFREEEYRLGGAANVDLANSTSCPWSSAGSPQPKRTILRRAST